MARRKSIKIGKENMVITDICALLDRFAHRVYVDRYHDELSPILEQNQGITKTGLTLDEFSRVTVGPGKLFAGYSGPCKDTDINLQAQTIQQLTGELADIVGGVVHGGTMWAFMKPAHVSAVDNNMLSVGVMPWQGVVDLASISNQLGDAFPKMDYLAVTGESYEDHANLFAQRLDYLVLLGGRTGALAEANSARGYKKPVITLVLENEKDLAFQNFQGGSWYTKEPKEAAKFVQYNLTPSQKLFRGTHVSIHDFDRRTIDKVRLTYAGNSSRKTDLLRHRLILDQVLMGISPSISQNVEGLSGGTYLGGVQAFYDSCSDMHISRSGIMSRKGIGYKIADVDNLIAYGPEWGSESEVTVRMSDIMLILGGGSQTGKEAKEAAVRGGRAGTGIPVIVIDDPIIGNWSSKRELNHPNVKYFSSGELSKTATYLNNTIQKIYRERSDVFR